MTETLTSEDRVPLTKLAAELGVNRRTVARWADEGYQGERLENYRIGRKRFSTKQAARRFMAAMNGELTDTAIGSAEQGPGMLCRNEHGTTCG